MKETKNLSLQDYGGNIRRTPADSTAFLDSVLVEEDYDRDGDGEIDCSGDRLQIRINCVAFIICEALLKGSDKGMTPSEYDAFRAEQTRQTYYTETAESSETSGT
jgi:alkaline phosphatase isozyme conversion protein